MAERNLNSFDGSCIERDACDGRMARIAVVIGITVHLSLPRPMRDFVVFNGANGLRAAIYN